MPRADVGVGSAARGDESLNRLLAESDRSKLFDVTPQVLSNLDYKVLPRLQVMNRNFNSGGSVWRICLPCRPLMVRNGAEETFEFLGERLYKSRPARVTPLRQRPNWLPLIPLTGLPCKLVQVLSGN